MPNEYDAYIEELNEKYDGFEQEDLDRLRHMFSASPIRKERDAAIAENRVLRERVAKAAFAEAGIPFDPADLRYPDDLDITDAAKVREWGVTKGWVRPPEPSAEDLAVAEGLAASDRIANAAAGAGTAAGVVTPETYAGWDIGRRRSFAQSNPGAVEALKKGESVSGVIF